MPPPARASFPAGLSARVRCRNAVVPELAGRLWRVGGLPRASGRAAARGAATLGCTEGLPIHRCYFGLHPPPHPLPLILCRIQHSSSRRKTWDVFPGARELYVGVGKVSKEQALGVRGLLRSLGPADPRNTLLAWPLVAPAGRVFRAGPTAVAELSRAAHAQRGRRSHLF